MTSVFISYSKHDRDAADFIAEQLRAYDIDVFIDYLRLQAGKSFSDQLRDEIKSRDYFLLLVSQNSTNSFWVKAEVNWAHHNRKSIIPLMLENVTMDTFWFLLHIQQVDFTRWRTDQMMDEAIQKLVTALEIETITPTGTFPALKQITVDNLTSLRELQVMRETSAYPSSLAFSSTGNLLAAGFGDILLKSNGKNRGFVKVWRPINGELLAHFRGHTKDVHSVTFSLQNKLASGSLDGTIRVWDVSADGKSRIYAQNKAVIAVTFEDFDNALISAQSNDEILKWDLKSGKYEMLCKYEHVLHVTLSRDEWLLAIAAENEIVVWDTHKHSEIAKCKAHEDNVRHLAYSHDDSILASSSDDRTIRLWNAETWQEQAILQGHRHSVRCISFSPDSKLLASGSNDGTVRIWDVKDQVERKTLTEHLDAVLSVAFSPDGTLLASASYDKTIRLWGIPSST